MCARARLCVCVSACERASVRASVRACERACVRACVRVCVCVRAEKELRFCIDLCLPAVL